MIRKNIYMKDSDFKMKQKRRCYRTKSHQLDIKENLSIHQAILRHRLLGSPAVEQMHNIFSSISHMISISALM